MKNSFVKFGLIASVALLSACQSNPGLMDTKLSQADINSQRQKILDMSKRALQRLYAASPELKADIEAAKGYGVFDVTSVNALVVVGSEGNGVIFDNASGKPTYMQTARVGTGPGLGYQEYYQVFIFKSDAALSQFKVGDTGGGDVSASVTAGTVGKQISFNPYISVYEVSEKGAAVQANWGGTAYRVTPDLN